MGMSVGTWVVAISLSVSQAPDEIDKEERDFQEKVFQHWWGREFAWKFAELPVEGKVTQERVPYSGYIYPDTAGGTMSALRKYDRAFNEGRLVATAFERKDTSQTETVRRPVTYAQRVGLFGVRAVTRIESFSTTPGWYGHCNGWTSAAIRHAEPRRSVTRNDVQFTPADIKALLAEIYMYNDPQMLAGDGIQINPGVFHAVLTNWLGRGSHPIGMEADPGEEKWNYPIHAYTTEFAHRSPRQVEVATNITYAMSSRGEFQQSPRIPYSKYFHYMLTLDEDGRITGGEYYRDTSSIDMLWVPLSAKKGGSEGNERGNPYVDVDEVLAIWRQSVPDELRRRWMIIDPPNRAPVVTSRSSSSVQENQTAVLTVTAADNDLEDQLAFVAPQELAFSLSGGADRALFEIEAETGQLRFAKAPNYEKPSDEDDDNTYEVEVQVDDGAGGTGSQLLRVTVTDVNDAPVITSRAGDAAENQVSAMTIAHVDEDHTSRELRYSLTGGDDQAQFAIDRQSGELMFKQVPDYEHPADADEDNVYEVHLQISDDAGASTSQLVRVTVTDANDPPVITSRGVARASENQLAVLTVNARDEDAHKSPLSYALIDSPDRDWFAIDSQTGKLTFDRAPDFEKPADADGDNIYETRVQVRDGQGGRAEQLVSVVVSDANDDPVIHSAKARAAENQLAVLTLEYSDEDLPKQPLTCSLWGGADRQHFAIDGQTGKLSFRQPPNFEKPADADRDNIYEVEVAVQDFALGTATQLLRIAVTDRNDAPSILSAKLAAVAENQPSALVIQQRDEDLPRQTLKCSIVGGPDRAMFELDSKTGALTFAKVPDFEKPSDADKDNVYEVEVEVRDVAGASASRLFQVSVRDANDPPVITVDKIAKSAENQLAVLTITREDADLPAQALRCSLSGGEDRNCFTLEGKSGALRFKRAPDFERPADADKNNLYEIDVKVEDSAGGSTVQSLQVAVTDANDNPVITSSTAAQVPENQTGAIIVQAGDDDVPAQSLIFTVSGGADQDRFAIDSKTGRLSFTDPPDFESPADANHDNTYEIEIQVRDGAEGRASQRLRIAVLDANDRPIIAHSQKVPEGQLEILTLDVFDQDRVPQMLRMSLTGGADRKLFAIDSKTGDLSFRTAADFDRPQDANRDNIYEVEVRVADAEGSSAVQLIRVKVTDVVD